MSIKIAIVEDDEQSAQKLSSYIQKYSEENGIAFDVDKFLDGDEIASDYKPIYNIIFLDIQMKRMDGMSAAEYIRKLDKDVIIIFITNMSQYAIKGYAVDAMDFLLKPLPYFSFSQQLKRSLEKLKQRESSYILVPVDGGVVKLDVSLILYVESFKHKMLLFTKDDCFSLITTMKELEQKLRTKNFNRCNNGYLVNLAHVNAIKDGCVIIGNHKLVISRAKKKSFMEALAGYVGGQTN